MRMQGGQQVQDGKARRKEASMRASGECWATVVHIHCVGMWILAAAGCRRSWVWVGGGCILIW